MNSIAFNSRPCSQQVVVLMLLSSLGCSESSNPTRPSDPDAGGPDVQLRDVAHDAPSLDVGAEDVSPDATNESASDLPTDTEAGADGAPDVTTMACGYETCTSTAGNYCFGGLCMSAEYADLALSEDHACAVLATSGPVYCLGNNDHGQLGDGTTSASGTWVLTHGPASARRVFVGKDHACAIDESGAPHCWGRNDHGQTSSSDLADTLTPRLVDAVTNATALALGEDHSCAVSAIGVRCWGGSGRGQLGDGTTMDSSTPTGVVLDESTQIVAGTGFTCALRTTGAAWCWGRNDRGQLGDGTTTDRLTPVEVFGDHRFTTLTAGDAFVCALTTEGLPLCWGANELGQIGDESGSFGQPIPTSPRFRGTPAGGGVGTLSAGSRHVIFLDGAGMPWGWGDASANQLGWGPMTMPTRAPAFIPFLVPTRVIAGGATSCGIEIGTSPSICFGSMALPLYAGMLPP